MGETNIFIVDQCFSFRFYVEKKEKEQGYDVTKTRYSTKKSFLVFSFFFFKRWNLSNLTNLFFSLPSDVHIAEEINWNFEFIPFLVDSLRLDNPTGCRRKKQTCSTCEHVQTETEMGNRLDIAHHRYLRPILRSFFRRHRSLSEFRFE